MLDFLKFDRARTKPFVGYDDEVAKRFWSSIEWLLEHYAIEVSGIERIPRGRALLVMNHAFGWDAMLPMAAIMRATGRRVWVLGEHLWWELPLLRDLAASVGAVDGTSENVDQLLQADELVLVLPGGLREAVKPVELRYRLLWGRRFGFVKAAMRNEAPIVPTAALGSDEWVDLVGNPYERSKRWLGIAVPLPRPKWGLPIIHRRRPKYSIGEQVSASIRAGESQDAAQRRIRREVRGAIDEMIDDALAARYGLG